MGRLRIDCFVRGKVPILFIVILFCFAFTNSGTAARRRPPKKVTAASTRAKPKPKPDTTVVDTTPARPLPAFAQLDLWEQRLSKGNVASTPIGHVARSIEQLCHYYGIAFDVTSPLTASPSPLEWPAVFADQKPNARRQRLELEKLLTQNGLRYQSLITVETKDQADVIARAISDGAPVLLNAPGAPIMFGYDRRETDPWWLVQWRERREIVYESERMRKLVWWTDDPAANIAWAIAGPDSSSGSSTLKPDDYVWLRLLSGSVAGNEREGVSPYPLSIRGIRDRLSSGAAMPELLVPVDSLDPLGLRRARDAREYTVNLVERLTALAVDSALSQPLRLALYSYHNSTQSLDRLDSLLYDYTTGPGVLSRCQANWTNTGRKDQSLAALTQLLEWERQASQEVAAVLKVIEKTKR